MNDIQRLQNNSLERATCMIIGVGASAGGLKALQELLRSLNDAQDMAIVFVQQMLPKLAAEHMAAAR